MPKLARVTEEASHAGRPIQCADAWVAAVAVQRWLPLVTNNPDDYAGALKRLDPLLDAVRGTAYEAGVEDRITRVRAAIEETSRPMTTAEREQRAASMYLEVLSQVSKRPKNPAQNVRDLEQLLAIAKGTDYESLVRRRLKREKAKLNR